MTKLEALPFDPERWEELPWRLGVCDDKHEAHYIGLNKNKDRVVFEDTDGLDSMPFEYCWMLPPPVVIEFKVGLYKSANRTHWLSLHEGVTADPEDKFRFIRWLTPDELAKGEVRVEG